MPADPNSTAVTTKQVADAVGVSEPTILRWGRMGLLPDKKVHFGGRRGRVALWPAHTIAQALWVLEKLNTHHTLEAIKASLQAGEFKPEGWG